MYLYIDESEDLNIYGVTGCLVKDNQSLLDVEYEVRRYIKSRKGLTKRQKIKILNEPKESYLYRSGLSDISAKFIEKIVDMKSDIFFCFYRKSGETFNKNRKEFIYQRCLEEMINSIIGVYNAELNIFYDEFDRSFNDKLISNIKAVFPNVENMEAVNSIKYKQIQSADICAGTLRRSLQRKGEGIFDTLENLTKYIEIK